MIIYVSPCINILKINIVFPKSILGPAIIILCESPLTNGLLANRKAGSELEFLCLNVERKASVCKGFKITSSNTLYHL